MLVTKTSHALTIAIESEEETRHTGLACGNRLSRRGYWSGGSLGAGKTRLARAIAEALGVDPGAISSPTFVLIHEYEGRLPVYHFDAYRLQSPRAFEDLGVGDYWDGAGVCLVEWADRVRELLPDRLLDDHARSHRPNDPAHADRVAHLRPAAARPAGETTRLRSCASDHFDDSARDDLGLSVMPALRPLLAIPHPNSAVIRPWRSPT